MDAISIGGDLSPVVGTSAMVRMAALQLEEWFAGERRAFDVLLSPPLSIRGEALRRAIVAVPFGETLSYGELALLAASSARAIGQACARNPFPLIVPCHRITNAGGSLGNYSAGDGTATKRWLLEFEQRGAIGRLL